MACDYFTKWVEAEPVATITARNMENFIWRYILCRFGVPNLILADNGKQLSADKLHNFCERFNINLVHTSVAYPQSNGLVESMNKNILQPLKKRLDDAKGAWVDEISGILWAIRTTSTQATGSTPFSLVYGTEAVIPAEMEVRSARTAFPDQALNSDHLKANLDLLEEAREDAAISTSIRAQQVSRYYNRRVCNRQFQVGDLVLRNCEASRPAGERKKLTPNWEGPYQINQVLGYGAYKLAELNGLPLSRTWNAVHLKKYYL